ncbi:MAG: ribonuclease III [Patescibacteria group bacterium]|nr:ribonuclease III [Patescibacteria group bacterium]
MNDMKDFSEFEKKIGVEFKDKNLLKQAFIHRSYLNENPSLGLSHNERLEFLGDAVLELVTTDYLYRLYTDKTEGELTAYRAALVNTISISKVATTIGVNEFLLLSKGEAKDIGKARQYILANTYESIIGAIFLDLGYEAAAKFIAETLFPSLKEIISNRLWQDAKSYFQERSQEYVGVTPSYSVLAEEGPDHEKHFTVGVFLRDELVARGEGDSKQEAEQDAARNALLAKEWNGHDMV